MDSNSSLSMPPLPPTSTVYLKITLMSFNLVMALYISVNVIIVLYSQHRKKSYLVGFYILSLLFTAVRSFYWFVTTQSLHFVENWSYAIAFSLEWFPVVIQFASFSLLFLFYAKLIGNQKWRARQRFLLPMYYIFNLLLAIFVMRWTIIGGLNTDGGDYTDWWRVYNTWLTSFIFLFLSVIHAYFGSRLLILSYKQSQRLFIFNSKPIGFINIIISFIFLTRSTYNVISINHLFDEYVFKVVPNNMLDITWYTFLAYLMWEIIPTSLLLFTIARPPAPTARKSKRKFYSPKFGIYQEINDEKKRNQQALLRRLSEDNMLPSEKPDDDSPLSNTQNSAATTAGPRWVRGGALFSDRSRYDSDNEDVSTSIISYSPPTPIEKKIDRLLDNNSLI